MVKMYILVGHRHPRHFAPEDLDLKQHCCQNSKSRLVLLHSSALGRHRVNVYEGAVNEFHMFLTSALRELESTRRVGPGIWPWQVQLTTVNVLEWYRNGQSVKYTTYFTHHRYMFRVSRSIQHQTLNRMIKRKWLIQILWARNYIFEMLNSFLFIFLCSCDM